ncbi:hypothetical protein M501DRAFT_993855 [Patellaria atrata CBS 101060]|uniref:Uncharacterized protein n=1 Tax=Patellaria atrata CBS 101060 TaxID=1346257 RepID=A0A9P4SIB6_9PEZI|nr:hypothetical protein M501DRAFT_993855 [Patellaria atrata CBS 101060]
MTPSKLSPTIQQTSASSTAKSIPSQAQKRTESPKAAPNKLTHNRSASSHKNTPKSTTTPLKLASQNTATQKINPSTSEGKPKSKATKLNQPPAKAPAKLGQTNGERVPAKPAQSGSGSRDTPTKLQQNGVPKAPVKLEQNRKPPAKLGQGDKGTAISISSNGPRKLERR